jgi:hypothetical protein
VTGGRTLQGQAGIKLGKRFQSQGIPISLLNEGQRNYFPMDAGGVLEFYPSSRIVTRFDGGDTMIRFGSVELPFSFGELIKTPTETTHNFQFSAGVGFRF